MGLYFLEWFRYVLTLKLIESLIILSVPQGISQIVNPTRMIGYSQAGMACIPNTVFTGDSFEFTLPDDANSGQAFTMCVQLTSGDCIEMALRNFTSKSIILIHLHVHVLPHSNFWHVKFPPHLPTQFLVKQSLYKTRWCRVLASQSL